MADLSVNQKYPNSWRMDHPNFGDVQQTVYAKGVITEVEKTADNPIAFKPRVKVRVGDGDESDFIPIWFCPKDKYWDPNSRAFDEDEKYHTKAWMSFRGGDEVIVMQRVHCDECEGLVPYCVLGFTDGVPRIGEDIIEFVTSQTFRWQISKNYPYVREDGPDDSPLGLLKEAELIEDVLSPTDYEGEGLTTSHSGTATLKTEITNPPDDFEHPTIHIWNRTNKLYTYDQATQWVNKEWKYNFRHQTFLVPVGPILLLIIGRWASNYRLTEETFGPYYSNSWPHWSKSCSIYDYEMYPGWADAHFDSCDGDQGHVTADAVAYVEAVNEAINYTLPDPERAPDPQELSLLIYAAPYTQEVYDQFKGNPPVVSDEFIFKLEEDPPEGFTKQTFLLQSIWDYFEYGSDLTVNDDDGVSLNIRPHTKQELQDAGLWPEGVE